MNPAVYSLNPPAVPQVLALLMEEAVAIATTPSVAASSALSGLRVRALLLSALFLMKADSPAHVWTPVLPSE